MSDDDPCSTVDHPPPRWPSTKQAVTALAVVALMAVPVSTAVATTTTTTSPALSPQPASNESKYTLPAPPQGSDLAPADYYLLWASTPTDQDVQPAPLDSLTSNASARALYTYNATTERAVTYREPRGLAGTWHAETFTGIPDTDQSVSHYPSSVSPRDRGLIKDAYIDIAAIDNSVVVHESNGATTQYVQPDGTVRGIFDYRMKLRQRDLRNYSEDDTAREFRAVMAHSVEDVTLIAEYNGQTRQFEADGYANIKAPFENLPAGTTVTLTLKTTITAQTTYRADQYRCADVDTSTDPNSCADWSFLNFVERNTTEQLTLTDSATVTVADPTVNQSVVVDAAADEAHVQFDVPPYFTHLEYGPYTIYGAYEHYTKRKQGYDTFHKANATGTTTYRSDITPVQTYAVPVRETAKAGATAGIDEINITTVDGRPVQSPSTADGVALSPPQSSTAPATVTIRVDADRLRQNGTITPPDATVNTLFGEATAAPGTVRTVKQATISASTNATDSHYEVIVSVTADQTGQPVTTAGDPDRYLIVTQAGRTLGRINTDQDGTTTLEIPKDDVTPTRSLTIRLEDDIAFDGPTYTADQAIVALPRPTLDPSSISGVVLWLLAIAKYPVSVFIAFKLLDWATPGTWLPFNPLSRRP
jgi:hypothetical protein